MKAKSAILTLLLVGGVTIILFVLLSNRDGRQGTGSEQTNEVRLRIPDTKFMGLLPLYVADEAGIFEKNGIVVEWLDIRDPRQAANLFFSGDADLIMSTFAGLLPAEVRIPGTLKLIMPVAETIEKPGSAILVGPDSDIESIEQLRGRVFGTYSGPSQRAYALLVLDSMGFSVPDDIEIKQVASSAQVQALMGGAFDALFAVETHLSVAKSRGAKVIENGVRPKYIADPFWIGSIAMHSEVQEDEKLIASIITALTQAVDLIESDEELARRILAERTNTSTEIAQVSALYSWITNPTEEQLFQIQELFDLLHEIDLLESQVNARDLFLLLEPISVQP